jgi:uncharacterized protein YxeA
MKKIFAVVSAVLLAGTLAACSSNYVMHTNDGRTIGMISYTDDYGKKHQINKSEVKEMVEGN